MMPRGQHDMSKPDTSDSQREQPRLPPWRRKSVEAENQDTDIQYKPMIPRGQHDMSKPDTSDSQREQPRLPPWRRKSVEAENQDTDIQYKPTIPRGRHDMSKPDTSDSQREQPRLPPWRRKSVEAENQVTDIQYKPTIPRGWHDMSKPDTSDSQREQPKLPPWRRKSVEAENQDTDIQYKPTMPRGRHDMSKPDTSDSQREQPRLPPWRRKSVEAENQDTDIQYKPPMPRGRHDMSKPDTSDFQRKQPILPPWRRKSREKESSLPSATSPDKFYEGRIGDIANEKLDVQAPSNLTGTLDVNEISSTYSPVDLQIETSQRSSSLDGITSLVTSGSSNSGSKALSPSSPKPLGLLPLLAGSPSNVAGSVALPSTTPQWMQFLVDQKFSRKEQDLNLDASSGHQHLDEKFQFEKSKWEEERKVLVTELEDLQEELENTKQAKEEAEQRIARLEGELRIKDEHVNELEQTLSTIQQTLDECKQKVSRDWVLSRDEILMTDTCLGVGGWGTVLLGKFRGCKVAVKQIHELILSPHNRRLFEREMNIASRCRHPCLLQFIGATNDEGTPLFVTELMESSLRTLLERQPLPTSDISILSVDIAQALNYLHLSKPPIIHRDISSANVLLWRQGKQWRGKVSDYGTANFMQQTMTVAPGAMIYSAPDALTSNQTIKIDVYSFGVLLCEMCVRELPEPQNREGQVAMVTNHGFRGLIRRCIQTEPDRRPCMEEIIENLEST